LTLSTLRGRPRRWSGTTLSLGRQPRTLRRCGRKYEEEIRARDEKIRALEDRLRKLEWAFDSLVKLFDDFVPRTKMTLDFFLRQVPPYLPEEARRTYRLLASRVQDIWKGMNVEQ
jgi:hypothetical protein